MMTELKIEPGRTALVIIDLQKGIAATGRPLAPIDGAKVVENASKLVSALRAAGAFIVPVHVGSTDGKDMPSVNAEQSISMASRHMAADWADIMPELGVSDSDHVILKHNWSAFYGTDLDLQLRRRHIDTIVLCGISTNIGVESTARDAYHHNYNQIFATDAMAAMTKEEHDGTVGNIFPRIGIRATTTEIINALKPR
ncbi:MAG: isochorismatase family protein [Candidatus Marsarchaeota archaeon]|nr:isochorismatase family protein [Candidatus Marsarchaeota archaeon]MCL5112493.1 isochorismatase family protein [Candidatus Marsarchaeota archaeon]